MLSRRSLLTGLIAAPAVIRVAPLMRIAPLPLLRISLPDPAWRVLVQEYERTIIYGNDGPQFEPVRFYGPTRVPVDG